MIRYGARIRPVPPHDFSRLSVRRDYRVNNSGVLFLGAWLSKFRVTRLTLTPLSPGGRRLREP